MIIAFVDEQMNLSYDYNRIADVCFPLLQLSKIQAVNRLDRFSCHLSFSSHFPKQPREKAYSEPESCQNGDILAAFSKKFVLQIDLSKIFSFRKKFSIFEKTCALALDNWFIIL